MRESIQILKHQIKLNCIINKSTIFQIDASLQHFIQITKIK